MALVLVSKDRLFKENRESSIIFENFTNLALILSEFFRDYIEDVESEYPEQKINRFG